MDQQDIISDNIDLLQNNSLGQIVSNSYTEQYISQCRLEGDMQYAMVFI